MPFNKNSDLPDWVKKAFPDNVQTAYREAFNGALVKHKDEGKASAIAISTVQKMGYVKKGDAWIKAEAGYVKGLGLTPGVIPHPNKKGETLNLTLQQLEEDVKNSNQFLNAGGEIRATKIHPKTSEEKIGGTLGFFKNFWIDPELQEPHGYFVPLDSEKEKIKNWVETGKLTAVSPGIYHDVATSAGIFPSLIDHVAFTPDPFNLKQNGFAAINAEKFSKAFIFFENKYISHEQGGGILDGIKTLFAAYFGETKTQQGGEEMELEQAKNRIIELEAQGKKDTTEIEARDKTILEQGEKITKYEKTETERVKTEKDTAVKEFTAKIDKLIEDTKVEVKNKEQLLKDFGVLYETSAKDRAGEILLSRFGDAVPIKNKLKHNQVRYEQEVIDLDTDEGRDKVVKLKEELARKMAKDQKIPAEKYLTCYEAASNAIDKQIANDEPISL